jgi:hypothetical protein
MMEGTHMADAIGPKGAKAPGKAKWVILAILALTAFVAVQTGWLGFGWAQLKSKLLPRDVSLLEWVPGDSSAVAIVDPHQIELKALGPEQGTARTALERMRKDIEKATDIDIVFDVDKLALTSSLVVARGRFDGEDLAKRLAEYRYVRLEHGGRAYLARAGEDAIAVIDDDILLYGDEASIKAAIDAEKNDTSLAKNDKVKDRLSKTGWNHPLLFTMQVTDERPSIRSLITGSTGPRAITLGARTAGGLDLEVNVEAATPSAAEELAKLLEEKRVDADKAMSGVLGDELAKLLSEVVKSATIKADAPASNVRVTTHVSQETLDASLKALEKSAPLGDFYKTMRLFQLLAPAP